MSASDEILLHLRSLVLAGALDETTVLDMSSAISFYDCSRNSLNLIFRPLCAAGYLSADTRGRYISPLWNGERLIDQYEVGEELLVLCADRLCRTVAPESVDRVASKCVGAFTEKPIFSEQGREALYRDIVALISVISRESQIEVMDSAIAGFFPAAVRRASLSYTSEDQLHELADCFVELGNSLWSRKKRDAASSIRRAVRIMKAVALQACSTIENREKPALFLFDDHIQDETDRLPFLGDLEIVDFEAWLEDSTTRTNPNLIRST